MEEAVLSVLAEFSVVKPHSPEQFRPIEMRRASFLVLLCISMPIQLVLSTCTVSKYAEGFGERLQCSNVSLSSVLTYNGPMASIMISESRISRIPSNAFLKYSKSLVSLNMHGCGISIIEYNAFSGLSYLKKLSLPNNNLTEVREQWLVFLTSLEQLDLSFNRIATIEPSVLRRFAVLKRLDLSENQLSCLELDVMDQMGPSMEKIRFTGNPLSFRCRAKMTLWLRDRGVNFKNEKRGEETWLDELLWQCALDDPPITDSEILMKECVLLNLFNQLRTALTTAESSPLTISQECTSARNLLTQCLARDGREIGSAPFTNGNIIRKLILQLEQLKSTI